MKKIETADRVPQTNVYKAKEVAANRDVDSIHLGVCQRLCCAKMRSIIRERALVFSVAYFLVKVVGQNGPGFSKFP